MLTLQVLLSAVIYILWIQMNYSFMISKHFQNIMKHNKCMTTKLLYHVLFWVKIFYNGVMFDITQS